MVLKQPWQGCAATRRRETQQVVFGLEAGDHGVQGGGVPCVRLHLACKSDSRCGTKAGSRVPRASRADSSSVSCAAWTKAGVVNQGRLHRVYVA